MQDSATATPPVQAPLFAPWQAMGALLGMMRLKSCANCVMNEEGYVYDLDEEDSCMNADGAVVMEIQGMGVEQGPGCMRPAGATFLETLDDLNGLDHNLLLFCATGNLSAVMWLLFLGAKWDSRDANGTTCLHVACRSGSVKVVEEMAQHRQLLASVDSAGWTPLHVAVLMGHLEVVVLLLEAGAPPNCRNNRGQRPADLCVDPRTFEAFRSFELHRRNSPDSPWQFKGCLIKESAGSCVTDQPFFVRRQPLLKTKLHKAEFENIGTLMFNRQPGAGLAFVVCTGVVHDHPSNLSTFLRQSGIDIRKVGSFLGEAFSLSHTVRLEFVNSSMLHNTGVISALVKVFIMVQMPDDLMKIDRLVQAVAKIWWRQHSKIRENTVEEEEEDISQSAEAAAQGELVGLELRRCLTGFQVLHQLMFSTVLLHWYIHNDGTGATRMMDLATWRRMNHEACVGDGELMDMLQKQIYETICGRFIAELAIETPGSRGCREFQVAADFGSYSNCEWDAGVLCETSNMVDQIEHSVLSPAATFEGWARIVGGGFPRVSAVPGMETVTYQQYSTLFSEVTTSTGFLDSPSANSNDYGVGRPFVVEAKVIPKENDFVWLSLCSTLLFIAASPITGAPYAFIELGKVCMTTANREELTLRISGGCSDEDSPHNDLFMPIKVVLLLPDGRWQELSVTKLDLSFSTAAAYDGWVSHIKAAKSASLDEMRNRLRASYSYDGH